MVWTSVGAEVLTNSKKKKEIIVSVNDKPKSRLMISRGAVAAFMVDAQEKNLYPGEMVVIS